MYVLERPKEPPPTGIDALRAPKNTSGFVGVSAVGRKKDRYQAKWWCAEHNAQRALPGLHDTPEDAGGSFARVHGIEAGCEFDEPVAERKFKRGTRPPRKKRVKTAASETAATPEATPEATDAPTGDNPNTDDGGATRSPGWL